MGWKTIRDAYRIEHIVKVEDGDIHIGSGYVGNLLTVTPEGVVTLNRAFRKQGELGRYQDEIEADKHRFAKLCAAEDTFGDLVSVYTYDRSGIVELKAEAFGWPNVTTCGQIQYDNLHFEKREEAVAAAFSNARSHVEWTARHVVEAEEDLVLRRGRNAEAVAQLARLEASETEDAEQTAST